MKFCLHWQSRWDTNLPEWRYGEEFANVTHIQWSYWAILLSRTWHFYFFGFVKTMKISKPAMSHVWQKNHLIPLIRLKFCFVYICLYNSYSINNFGNKYFLIYSLVLLHLLLEDQNLYIVCWYVTWIKYIHIKL